MWFLFWIFIVIVAWVLIFFILKSLLFFFFSIFHWTMKWWGKTWLIWCDVLKKKKKTKMSGVLLVAVRNKNSMFFSKMQRGNINLYFSQQSWQKLLFSFGFVIFFKKKKDVEVRCCDISFSINHHDLELVHFVLRAIQSSSHLLHFARDADYHEDLTDVGNENQETFISYDLVIFSCLRNEKNELVLFFFF